MDYLLDYLEYLLDYLLDYLDYLLDYLAPLYYLHPLPLGKEEQEKIVLIKNPTPTVNKSF